MNESNKVEIDLWMQHGGPAFPIALSEHGPTYYRGMSLRDYFAASVVQGLVREGYSHCTDIATVAYAVADKMLTERAK